MAKYSVPLENISPCLQAIMRELFAQEKEIEKMELTDAAISHGRISAVLFSFALFEKEDVNVGDVNAPVPVSAEEPAKMHEQKEEEPERKRKK